MSEEKNLRIKDTIRATRERHSGMDCRVISVKVQESKLSKAKLEKLYRCFLEGKWLYNAVLFSADDFPRSGIKTVTVKVKNTFEEREIKCLSSQMKQSVVDSVKTNICNLAKAKMPVQRLCVFWQETILILSKK